MESAGRRRQGRGKEIIITEKQWKELAMLDLEKSEGNTGVFNNPKEPGSNRRGARILGGFVVCFQLPRVLWARVFSVAVPEQAPQRQQVAFI